jgi:pyrrolidone-carboxylate peptidase
MHSILRSVLNIPRLPIAIPVQDYAIPDNRSEKRQRLRNQNAEPRLQLSAIPERGLVHVRLREEEGTGVTDCAGVAVCRYGDRDDVEYS